MPPHEKRCLLNPGPVTLTSRVRAALQREDLCHREPEFAELQADVRSRLACVYEEAASDYTATLLTGSGTAAVEAMLSSLAPWDGITLVVANGVYGERLAKMLEVQRKPFEVIRTEWTEPIDLEAVRRRLRTSPTIHSLATIHHETTTGRLNNLAELGALCRDHGVGLLLDTVSSFGGESIDFAGWNIDACAATANKCLHGVPGISFVLTPRSVLEQRLSAASSLYLDLFANHAAQEQGFPQFTPAVQVMYALQEALRELADGGGWRARRAHYSQLSRRVREGLAELGIRTLLGEDAVYSSMLASFHLPEPLGFEELFVPLKEAGFVIYPGQRQLYARIFRIAVMGDLMERDMAALLAEFRTIVGRARPGG